MGRSSDGSKVLFAVDAKELDGENEPNEGFRTSKEEQPSRKGKHMRKSLRRQGVTYVE